jgi:isopenicillin-N N-acyltransferase like protein
MNPTFTSSVCDSYQRGVEFGSAHAAQVAQTVADYDALFALRGAEVGVSAEAVRELVPRIGVAALERVDGWAPELGQEIRGIAAGAGVALEQIAAINARTETLAAVIQGLGGSGSAGRDECSTVVAISPGKAEPVAIQNWDWYASWRENWLVWVIPHPDGTTTTTVTEYGIVGKIGIGPRGVGVLLNKLGHERDGHSPVGVPIHVICRQVMDTAGSVDQALELVRGAGTSASSSLTIVAGNDAGRAAACAELWPGGVEVITPTDGFFCRTNHFLAEAPHGGDINRENVPDTYTRLAALHRQLDSDGASATASQIRAALSDHGEGPNSLCVHPDPAEPEWARYATLLSASLNFTEQTVDVTAGTPCAHI